MECGSFADWVTAGVAVGAIFIAIWQIVVSKQTARDASALAAWSNYLSSCLLYPELTSDPVVREHLPSGTTDGIADQLSTKSEQYLWFLSNLFNSCELILLSQPRSTEWRATMVDQISFHWQAAEQVELEWLPHYGKQMRALIKDGVAKGKAEEAKRQERSPPPSRDR